MDSTPPKKNTKLPASSPTYKKKKRQPIVNRPLEVLLEEDNLVRQLFHMKIEPNAEQKAKKEKRSESLLTERYKPIQEVIEKQMPISKVSHLRQQPSLFSYEQPPRQQQRDKSSLMNRQKGNTFDDDPQFTEQKIEMHRQQRAEMEPKHSQMAYVSEESQVDQYLCILTVDQYKALCSEMAHYKNFVNRNGYKEQCDQFAHFGKNLQQKKEQYTPIVEEKEEDSQYQGKTVREVNEHKQSHLQDSQERQEFDLKALKQSLKIPIPKIGRRLRDRNVVNTERNSYEPQPEIKKANPLFFTRRQLDQYINDLEELEAQQTERSSRRQSHAEFEASKEYEHEEGTQSYRRKEE